MLSVTVYLYRFKAVRVAYPTFRMAFRNPNRSWIRYTPRNKRRIARAEYMTLFENAPNGGGGEEGLRRKIVGT